MREVHEEISGGLSLAVEAVDMPHTVEDILVVLRRILAKPYVQSIALRTGRPIEVAWYKAISDSLKIGDPEEDPDLVLSKIDLEEFSTTKSPKETLLEALMAVANEGLRSTHLFVGSVSFFRDWLGVPSVRPFAKQESIDGRQYYNFIGLNLLEVESLSEDVVVLLGSPAKDATTTEISFGLKIVT